MGAVDNDRAYPWLVKTFIPTGLKGLVVAALVAAIVSSLASMLNSTSTIFTLDIYKPYFSKNASEKELVTVGRITSAIALIIAIFIAPLLGNIKQAFQYIQEYTGIVSPGILAIFLLGLFYKKATNRSAIFGALFSIVFAFYLKIGQNGWMAGTPLAGFFPSFPWMDQMLIVCLGTMLVMVIYSYFEARGVNDPKGIPLKKSTFHTDSVFNILATVVILILTAIYAIFW